MTENERRLPFENPYASPLSPSSEPSYPRGPHHTSLLGKFVEAGRLLCTNLLLFSAIVLTVWLPGNLLVNYLTYHVYAEDDFVGVIRSAVWIEGIFGPIYVAAMIHALWQLKSGQRTRYSEAIAAGFRSWGRLFAARFVASLLIMLGFIALIVPGIVLCVRYALLDSPVVLEEAGTAKARQRSAELTVGVRWQILCAGLLWFVAFLVLSSLVSLPVVLLPQFDTMAIAVVLDCFLDVAYAVIQIVMFLYYWEAVSREGLPAEPSRFSVSGEE
jgi:hypothetical protein